MHSNQAKTSDNRNGYSPAATSGAGMGLQCKLTIGAVNDPLEAEADAMADRVMRMPDAPMVQRQCVGCEEEGKVQRKPLAASITPFIQTKAAEGGTASDAVTSQINATKGSGNSLDSSTQTFMQSRFGADFSDVKIHTGGGAVQMNRELNAKAFTVGSDIYFSDGEYQPNSDSGKQLLAHELAHTIQQKSVSLDTAQSKNKGYRSSALQIRSNLPISSVTKPVIQRLPITWGGEWFADTYTEYSSGTGRGIDDMHLRFKPGVVVDAELIGLTQSIRALHNKTPFHANNDPFYKGRAIKSGDAITVNPATKETDEGSKVDRVKDYNNPIYPVQSLPSASLDDTNTSAGWGELGYRYTDNSGALKEKDATLIDAPKIRSVDVSKNSGQIFETTALATKGTQAGTYYGSVRWGWRSDDAGNFAKLPLDVVSQGVPSSTFIKSAEMWNASKSSTGADTVDLPTVDVKVTTTPISDLTPSVVSPLSLPSPPMSKMPIRIPAGTRVQIIFYGASTTNGERLPQIRVVDGLLTGTKMTISNADLANLRDERS